MGIAAKEEDMKLEVLSWNVWYGTQLDKVSSFIKDSKADIIGLQEVTQTPEGTKNLAEELSRDLGFQYAYANGADARSWGKNFFIGNAVLSRFPIVSRQTHILSKENSRSAIQADIMIDGRLVHVFSTHFLHTHQKPSIIQEEQARTLVSVVPDSHAIVMGDFNATPESATLAIMKQKLRKTDGESQTPTWSLYEEGCCKTNGVTVRLDYIFVTHDIQVLQTTVRSSDGSDHLPISADIEL